MRPAGLTGARHDPPPADPAAVTAWDDVKRLFAEALGRDASTRAEWLDAACGSRAWVRREVESLLDAHGRAGTFFETQPGQAQPGRAGDDWVGRRLGPYTAEELLGRGGMGAVYRARRTSPEREVALKVVRWEAGGAEVRRRFEAEAQILARFDHPWIASLYDAGMTPEGRAYFVMELVRGRPLDEACAAGRWGLRSRLEIFLKVCAAVSYAHGRLVVHRDLKPGNLLITADGQPKLLDFGIARLLDEPSPRATTATGLRLMTPEFASPEQVRGERATVATDVHGLGLLLGLLLTGRPPFRLTSRAPAELVRVVCVEDPPRASESAGAPRDEGRPGFDPVEPPHALARLLRGDLDAIVAKALRKEPERRYASVEQLAADVRRYLDGLPVRARDGRWRYRLGKFARRQRVLLALVAALAGAVATGWAATARQARVAREERARAERRFADLRQLATRFLFDFHDAVADLPGSTAAREMVVKTALEHLGTLSREAGDDASLRLELARAWQRLGAVQGLPGRGHLGDAAGALRSLAAAWEVLEGQGGAARSSGAFCRARLDLASAEARLRGQVGEYARALAMLERAQGEGRALLRQSREREDVVAVARVSYESGVEQARRHALAAAELSLRECLRLSLDLAARFPDDPLNLRRVGPPRARLADVLVRLGHYREAREHVRELLALRRAAWSPDSSYATRGLVFALEVVPRVERDGDPAAAQAAYAESLALTRGLAARDPRDDQAREDAAGLAAAWCGLLNRRAILTRPGDPCGQALRHFDAQGTPHDANGQFNLANTLVDAGRERLLRGDPEGALRLEQRALVACDAPLLSDAGVGVVLLRADARLVTVRAQLELRRPRAALEAARRAQSELLEQAAGSQDLDTVEALVAAHTLAGRAASIGGRPDCAEIAAGRARAQALRAATRELPLAPRALEEWDALDGACRALR